MVEHTVASVVLSMSLAASSVRAVPGTERGAEVERRLSAMGTELVLRVGAGTRAEAIAASEAALSAIERAESRLSTWRSDTELARLNAAPVGEPIALSSELARELREARDWWRATEGAFDPSVGGSVRCWGLRDGGRVPGDAEIADALVPGGFAALELRGDTATRTDARLCIDEGGFGKGAALDHAVDALRRAGIHRATLDLGGQIAVLGSGPHALAIADPRARSRAIAEIVVDEGSLSTSGNSERGVIVAGRRVGHILDPRTGRPSRDFGSATVWARSATAADCLSTGLFVLGPDGALEYARTHPEIGLVVIETSGAHLRVRASANLAGRVSSLASDVILVFESDVADVARR